MARSLTRGLLGFFLVAFIVIGAFWLPDSARAVEPVPPPVEPIPGLPSTTQKGLTSAGGIGDNVLQRMAWYRQQMAAMEAAKAAQSGTTVATTVAKAVPITGAKTFAAGAVGGVVTAAFMAGWMVTDGTLAMYGNVTGDSPLEGTCDQPEWATATIQVLYPFSAPACTVTYDLPNDGITGAETITVAGVTLTYEGFYASGGGTSGYWCYDGPFQGWPGAGYAFNARYTTYQAVPGVPYWSGNGSMGPGSTPNSQCGGTAMFMLHNNGGGEYELGHVLRVVDTTTGAVVATMTAGSADPGRVPSCQLTWPDGSVTTTEGDPYTESNGFPWSEASALCNDGFVSKPGHGPDLLPAEIEIGSTRQDTGDYSEVQTQPVPEFTEDEKKGLTAPTPGGGLVLQKVIGTTTSSCMNWDADCSNWWADTDEGANPTTDEGVYRCTYNGSAVSLGECGIYRFTFDTRTSTPTVTDPDTGTQTPWYSGAPSPFNSTSPATGPTPGEACMASWPAAPDPLSWVMHPVKCALVWAFVPRTATILAKTAVMSDAWAETMPGQLPALVSAAVPSDLGLDGCQGPHVFMPLSNVNAGWVDIDWYPLAACDGAMADVAAFARLLGGAVLVYVTALGMIRRAASVINAPGLGSGAA